MKAFANPYLACTKCGAQVTHRPENRNRPCGHHADFASLCPSWGPVDGCRCTGSQAHGEPPRRGDRTVVSRGDQEGPP